MKTEKFLVTGALGCIGAWVTRHLVSEGTGIIATDASDDFGRLQLLMSDVELAELDFRKVDVTDTASLRDMIDAHSVSHVIHLAGLQVPFCRADPVLGSKVNVTGTISVFEAVRQASTQIRGLAYASSVAVFGPPELYPTLPVPDDAPTSPGTLYGVYKVANENTALLYWKDWHVASVGLRPYIVYGVGRDQGLTSDIAKSILAAVSGVPFTIQFGGPVALQYASDVAEMFIRATRSGIEGTAACNVRNDVVPVDDFINVLKNTVPEAEVDCLSTNRLPFPSDLDDSKLREVIGEIPHTALSNAIRETANRFQTLIAEGKLAPMA
ncbi:MAG TPA: NAD-dependent epimerase/dehydratase family protein [Acidobacteriota bacterium]|nr:NAD-dependent epimerase/dehydratase family protein [Acidobacteriota bacterium]